MIFPSNRQYLTNADFPHFEGKNITFGITGDCNLRCTYCYIHEKRQDREMRFETAKQIVDRMFEEPYAYLDDNFSEKNTKLEKTDPNRDITKKVIFDFIGGEDMHDACRIFPDGSGSYAGTFYNCIRFAPVSCLDGKGYPLGNLENGYNMENYNRLKSMTRRSCSDDECFNCEVASGCSYCPGQQYDEHGDFNIRSKSIFECISSLDQSFCCYSR
jgi:sulfatase maturation enzyme AslB (radical SAM superfamily)